MYLSSAGEQELVAQEDGVFFDASAQGVVADLFMYAIHDWLDENGFSRGDYHLSFELPGFEAQAHGDGTVQYDAQFDGDFSLSATVTSIMNPANGTSAMRGALQYRTADSQGYDERDTHGRADNVGAPVFFGRVAAGDYLVRYVAYEDFTFDGVSYLVPRYSNNEFACKVVKAVVPLPSITSTSIVYGTAAGDISIADSTGRWTFDDAQEGCDRAQYLEVSDSPHTVYFNYVSNDQNYLPREHIPIAVTVTPRVLRVYVGDAYSMKGEPQADLTKIDYIVGPLVGDDTEEELGLEFYLTTTFVPDRAGYYTILARISDKNYSCLTVSLYHSSVPGGTYTVYENKFEATATDGRKFTVFCDSLPAGVTLAVETGESIRVQGDIHEGAKDFYYQSIASYRICFYDSLHNRVLPTGACSIEWEGVVEGATYIAIFGEAGVADSDGLIPYDGDVRSVTLDRGTDSVAFFKAVTEYAAESVWTWYNILLTALAATLFVALVALGALILKRRRKTWR